MTRLESKRKYSAFTLIELLVTLAIISILLASVYPSYSSMVLRTHRTEGASLLFEIQSQLERYYFKHQTYPEKLSALRHYHVDKIDSENANYSVKLDKASQKCPIGSCYLLIAEHRSGSKTETLSLSSKGEKQGPW